MNIFKKKPKEIRSPSQTHHKFSTQALEVEYNVLMENYKANPNEQTSRDLQKISRILNERAYQQGNGKLFNDLKEHYPQITEQKFRSFSKSEKEYYQRIIENIREADIAGKKLSEETVDLELDNYEKEYGSVDKPSPQNQVIHQTNYEKKQDEEVVLINDISIKDPLVQTIDKIKQQQPEIFEKKQRKIPGLNFLKKKKLIRLPKELDGDFVMKPKKEIGNAKTYSEKEVQELLKKKAQIEQTISPTPEPMSAPQKHEQLVETRLKGLFKKKDKKEIEKLPDLICPDCSHHIKTHQKKGEPTGCKCGCLMTPDQIKSKHDYHKPEPQPQPEDDTILKQAQQMASMKSQAKPTEITEPIEPTEHSTPPPSKLKSLCANCDHIPKAHFDGQKFCTVIGCTCEVYRSYPE